MASSSQFQIDIHNTNVYYQIRDCYLERTFGIVVGTPIGIHLVNTTNGYIENNTINDGTVGFGIYMYYTNDTIITKNIIKNTPVGGIWASHNCHNNIISNNIVTDLSDPDSRGIRITYNCSENEIYNNTISRAADGIYLSDGNNKTIIKKNNITECTSDGILLEGRGFGSKILENNLANHTVSGIHLSDYSNETEVKYNTIEDCDSYGIIIESDVNDTTVRNNNFINSNGTLGAQALNNGDNSDFDYNYWVDHTSPDTDSNGIVDIPYTLNGTASSNTDEHPLTSKFVHTLTQLTITSPNGGETLKDAATISWTASVDSFSHTVTYLVEYSGDGGSSWSEIISSISDITYSWDTTSMADGNNFLIRVTSSCEEGLTNTDVSDDIFTINNTDDTSNGTSTSGNGKSSPGWTLIPFLLSICIIVHRKKTNRK